jgi:ABC-type glutathione transport system ATPase component
LARRSLPGRPRRQLAGTTHPEHIASWLEPTGNLDEDTRDEIIGLLETMWREHGLTMVLVTHDSTVARRAQRIGVMKNGRLTFKQPARSKAGRTQPAVSAPLDSDPLDSEPLDSVAPSFQPSTSRFQSSTPRFQPPDLPPADSVSFSD